MPPKQALKNLPAKIRNQLDERLLQNGFGNYTELANWLREKGYEFSRATVARYGHDLEKSIEEMRLATQQAQQMRECLADDEAALSEMALQMIQSLLFTKMVKAGSSLESKEMVSIAKAITEASKSTLAVKKYQEELQERLAVKFAQLEKESQDNGSAGGSIDPRTLQRIREEIYGVF